VIVAGEYYSITWVEALYFIGAVIMATEILKVSKPGIDNTREAIFMTLTSIAYFGLFVGSLNGDPRLAIFRNTEFLILMAFSGAESIIAFMVNARTLKRTIDYTVDNHHG
jgi:hypothetical protein